MREVLLSEMMQDFFCIIFDSYKINLNISHLNYVFEFYSIAFSDI